MGKCLARTFNLHNFRQKLTIVDSSEWSRRARRCDGKFGGAGC